MNKGLAIFTAALALVASASLAQASSSASAPVRVNQGYYVRAAAVNQSSRHHVAQTNGYGITEFSSSSAPPQQPKIVRSSVSRK